MPWLQLKLQTEQSHVELLSEQLLEHGALSITYEDAADQPLFEPPPGATPIWSNTLITGMFDADCDIDNISAQLKKQYHQQITAIRYEILEDKDWVREWMDRYQPMQFGENLWIVPSHHTPPKPDAINILLDPGLAFGTGTHPTTAMCLSWLAQHPPQQRTVIDYGCGSGILAIAAAKLDAKRVYAVDNDPQALIATQSNANQNVVGEKISCFGVPAPLSEPVDLLLANILAGPLIDLAPVFAKLIKPEGQLVLSGILAEQAQQVIAAYQTSFIMQLKHTQDEWVLLTGTRH